MFKGLGNLGNIACMIKQAQEMGPKMQEAQEKLKQLSVTGTAGEEWSPFMPMAWGLLRKSKLIL